MPQRHWLLEQTARCHTLSACISSLQLCFPFRSLCLSGGDAFGTQRGQSSHEEFGLERIQRRVQALLLVLHLPHVLGNHPRADQGKKIKHVPLPFDRLGKLRSPLWENTHWLCAPVCLFTLVSPLRRIISSCRLLLCAVMCNLIALYCHKETNTGTQRMLPDTHTHTESRA